MSTSRPVTLSDVNGKRDRPPRCRTVAIEFLPTKIRCILLCCFPSFSGMPRFGFNFTRCYQSHVSTNHLQLRQVILQQCQLRRARLEDAGSWKLPMVQRPPKLSEDLIIMSMNHYESTSFLLYMDTDYLSVKIIIDYPKFSFVGLTADQTFGAPVLTGRISSGKLLATALLWRWPRPGVRKSP